MFLFAITKQEIAQNLKSMRIEETKVHSHYVTIITDNFLSKFIMEENGFSIIESPILSSNFFEKYVFSRISYNEYDDSFDICRPVVSSRPIYYCIEPNGDFFCSTHISLLRDAGVPIREDPEVLPEFFVYRYVMPPKTLFKNIQQLESGGKIIIKTSNDRCKLIKTNNYQIPSTSEKCERDIDSISKNVLDYLTESIENLSEHKNRISVLLSGGLDSSILFKLCQNNFQINDSFSTGYPFEETEKNTEKEYALSAADAFKINHTYFKVSTEEYLRGFIESISVAEEPIHHLQSVMFYLLFKKCIPQTKDIVVFGEGADGIFGNSMHNFFFRTQKLNFFTKIPFLKIITHQSKALGKFGDFFKSLERSNLELSNPNNLLWSLGAYGSEDWACSYFNASKQDIIRGRFNCMNQFTNRSVYDIISALSLCGEGLITQSIWSKIAESNKKIAFYPFMNINLLNYVFNKPWEVKLKHPKNILREVAHQLEIPNFIINRPKSAFGIKSNLWSNKGGAFEPLVPLASKAFDEKLIRSVQCSNPRKAMVFWNILNYTIWKRIIINEEPKDILLDELMK